MKSLFKFISIKIKLILLFSFLFFITLFVVIAFFVFDTKKAKIESVTASIKEIHYLIKDSEVCQKNFLIYETINPIFYETGKSNYILQYNKNMEMVRKKLDELKSYEEFDTEKFRQKILKINELINQHNNKFDSLIYLIRLRGFKDYGLIGEMRNLIHSVEDFKYRVDLGKLLMIRRHEKDYLLRKQEKYITKIKAAINELTADIKQSPIPGKSKEKVISLLENYEDKFDAMIRIDHKIGSHFGEGLKANIHLTNAEIRMSIDDLGEKVNKEAVKITENLRAVFILVLIVGILLNMFLILIVIFKLGVPLTDLSKSIRSVIASNFSKEFSIEKITSNDEIGQLSEDFSLMLNKVHEHTDEILRQKEKISKAYSNIQLLSDIGRDVIAHLKIEQIVETVFHNLNKLADVSVFAIGIFKEDRNGLEFWGINKKGNTTKLGFDSLDNNNYLSVKCFTDQKELVINDFESEQQALKSQCQLPENDHWRESMIYIPLTYKRNKLGVITVQSYEKNAYEENHLNLLRNLGIYITIALENANAYYKIEKQQKELIEQAEDLKQAHEEILVNNEALEQQKEEILSQRDEIYKKQKELAKNEEKYRTLVENLNDVIFTTRVNGYIEYLSPSFINLIGEKPDAYLGQHISKLVKPEDIPEMINYFSDNLEPGKENEIISSEVRMLNNQNQTVWVYIKMHQIVTDGEVTGFHGIISDISERRKALQAIEDANEELKQKNNQITDQQKHITDSIYYAKRIQEALLPAGEYIEKQFPEHFILYYPRDIVSGDFYWVQKKVHNVMFAVADCTGHGVPGAFMSMLGISFLNEIVNKNLKKFYDNSIHVNEIITQLRQKVIKSLKQTGKFGESKDGMDMGLCMINLETKEMQFTGAFQSLLLYRKDKLIQFKADRMPVGFSYHDIKEFTNHSYQLEEGDTLYMHSDGFVDQFGGKHGRKYMSKKFKNLLMDIHTYPMEEQKEILANTINSWMGDTYEQVDDILVFGVKV